MATLRGVGDPSLQDGFAFETVLLENARGGNVIQGTGCPDARNTRICFQRADALSNGVASETTTPERLVDHVANLGAMPEYGCLDYSDHVSSWAHDVKRQTLRGLKEADNVRLGITDCSE